jgi:predicted unusual protein kinase regulating ubiquinone biosynthesis (AarF/ABC1/UbiB family)
MTRRTDLPTQRLARLANLARVGARTGASLLTRGDSSRAADQAAEILGSLRGLAAKVGQMASYVDGIVPEAHRDTYEKALTSLRTSTPTSSSEVVLEILERELGGSVDQRFAELDETPFASASIGQVHRARLHDGTEVAVKIQHPGIEQAVESDLKNGSVIQGMVSTLGPRAMNAKAVYDEIARRFREELDYEHEAGRQELFATFHEGDPTIHIPKIIRSHTTRRVLTSELAHGGTLEEAGQAPEEARRKYAEILWRFVFKGNLVHGMFNADPHPGNYLFREDGSIVFLDFGCVQPILETHLAHARVMHRGAFRRDTEAFQRGARALLSTKGGAFEDAVLRYTRRCFEPLFDAPYRITRDYAASLVAEMSEMKGLVLARDRSFVPLAPEMALMNRLQFGFYSVLARLDVEVDYASVEEGFWNASGLPSS